jgi:threonine/homoserine/homoserine lactone efflux protein
MKGQWPVRHDEIRVDATRGATAMDIGILARGLLIGFSIAAPVGPIGVLCIRRTLADGRAAGLASGMGAATADAIYGAVAGFGLTMVSGLLLGQQGWLRLLGGLFLLYLGARTALARPATQAVRVSGGVGLAGAYASTLGLTLTNPATILSFLGIFAGLGLANTAGRGYQDAALLVLGVFLGSALWWLLLSGGVSLLRARLGARALVWVNRGSGALIAAFGLLALVSMTG